MNDERRPYIKAKRKVRSLFSTDQRPFDETLESLVSIPSTHREEGRIPKTCLVLFLVHISLEIFYRLREMGCVFCVFNSHKFLTNFYKKWELYQWFIKPKCEMFKFWTKVCISIKIISWRLKHHSIIGNKTTSASTVFKKCAYSFIREIFSNEIKFQK